MTVQQTMSLGVLVQRVMANPMGFVETILQQILDQLARDGVFADSDTPPESLVATALGGRLARMVAADGPVEHEMLIGRNSTFAAAVGACDCWGQDGKCPLCEGAGTPGWVLPDQQLFTTYVYPAVKTISKHQKENGDV
ncbi:hypothetical protein [Nonomuraea sp. NPDC049141]|uniref:hypothetical protein n=1 Tax=Nonomuraea sp. NPDC049141 TaxID=3155500 RepID=UPI0033D7C2E7